MVIKASVHTRLFEFSWFGCPKLSRHLRRRIPHDELGDSHLCTPTTHHTDPLSEIGTRHVIGQKSENRLMRVLELEGRRS